MCVDSTSNWCRIHAYDVNMMLFWHIWRRINAHVVNMMSFWHLINDAVNWKGWNQMKCSSYIPSQWHITPGILLSTAYSSNLHYLIVHLQYSSFIADNKQSIHPLHLDKLRNSYLNQIYSSSFYDTHFFLIRNRFIRNQYLNFFGIKKPSTHFPSA